MTYETALEEYVPELDGIDDLYADCTPEEKDRCLGRTASMIGNLQAFVSAEEEAKQRRLTGFDATVEKHYIPKVPFDLNQAIRKLGGQWDADKRQWFYTDPAKAEQAERLLQEYADAHGPEGAQVGIQETDFGMQ